jgi:hypothetical protein
MRRSWARWPASVVALAVLGACGDDDGSPDPATGDTTGTTAAPVLGAELQGRWAHYDIVAYEDPAMKTMIVSYGFTDFAVEDGALVESEQFCTAEQVSDQPIQTAISDAGTQAIRPVSTPVEVTGSPGELRVQRPATPTPVGIELEDPANDELPSDPDDPRISDDDGDGKPGITVTIEIGDTVSGELYLARREIFAYDMRQEGPDTLSGTVIDSSEQLVIGASDPIFETDAQWVQVDDLSFSPILLERVDEGWDCDRLVAERDALFPPVPPIEW